MSAARSAPLWPARLSLHALQATCLGQEAQLLTRSEDAASFLQCLHCLPAPPRTGFLLRLSLYQDSCHFAGVSFVKVPAEHGYCQCAAGGPRRGGWLVEEARGGLGPWAAPAGVRDAGDRRAAGRRAGGARLQLLCRCASVGNCLGLRWACCLQPCRGSCRETYIVQDAQSACSDWDCGPALSQPFGASALPH